MERLPRFARNDNLSFPRHLHRLHEFQYDGQWFVADLDAGVVLPEPEPIRQILSLCETHTHAEIVRELVPAFDRKRLEEAFLLLDAFDERGWLFADVKLLSPTIATKRLRICVSPNFLFFKQQTDFFTQWVHYHLLAALAKVADVALLLPKLQREQEAGVSFPAEAIERIPVEEWGMHAILPAIPNDCDGVLLLSPFTRQDLMWYRHVECPVVAHVQSETVTGRGAVNVLLQHATVMRDFDTLVVDALWTMAMLQGRIEKTPPFEWLLPGTDNLPLPEKMEKASFWNGLAAQFPDKQFGSEALVGINCPSQQEWLLPQLCASNPNWTFIAFDPLVKALVGNRLPNLLSLDIFTADDLMVFNAFVAQMDVLVYQGRLGTPILPLLMAIRAGCPCLVDGDFEQWTKMPAFASCLSPLPSGAVGDVSEAIQRRLSTLPKDKPAVSCTWEEAAQQLVQVFQQCHQRRVTLNYMRYSRRQKPLFHVHYVKSRPSVETAAHLLPDFANANLEDALRLALEEEISPNEVEVVLKRLKPT